MVKGLRRDIISYLASTLCCFMTVGCSPYVYKSEISEFASGVGHLSSAYSSGITEANRAYTEKRNQTLVKNRSAVAWSAGCTASGWDKGSTQPCMIVAVGEAPHQSQIAEEAANRAPKCLFLKDYAQGLAAISNSADREALNSAQANLKASVEALFAHAYPDSPTAGLFVDIFNDVSASALDTRRYEVLKATVTRVHPEIEVLGLACGEALHSLRFQRGTELDEAGKALRTGLGPQSDAGVYAARIAMLQVYADTLEQLRQSDPRAATEEMVKAHGELRTALANDTRQVEPVARAVASFAKKAAAVQNAFAKADSKDAAK